MSVNGTMPTMGRPLPRFHHWLTTVLRQHCHSGSGTFQRAFTWVCYPHTTRPSRWQFCSLTSSENSMECLGVWFQITTLYSLAVSGESYSASVVSVCEWVLLITRRQTGSQRYLIASLNSVCVALFIRSQQHGGNFSVGLNGLIIHHTTPGLVFLPTRLPLARSPLPFLNILLELPMWMSSMTCWLIGTLFLSKSNTSC